MKENSEYNINWKTEVKEWQSVEKKTAKASKKMFSLIFQKNLEKIIQHGN